MTPTGYFIYIKAPQSNTSVVLTVLNVTGTGQVIAGLNRDEVTTHLIVIPAGSKTKEEVTTSLQSETGFSHVSVISLSNPIKATELLEVRKIFDVFNWNSDTLTDDELSLFLESKIQGLYTYYLDIEHTYKKRVGGLTNIHLKRLEDHPEFSPDWLRNNNGEKHDMKSDSDIIEMVDVVFQSEVRMAPPPPPFPPENLNQMTDAQIRQWMKENDPRPLQDEDIDVERTTVEILITIYLDDSKETVIYKLSR